MVKYKSLLSSACGILSAKENPPSLEIYPEETDVETAVVIVTRAAVKQSVLNLGHDC